MQKAVFDQLAAGKIFLAMSKIEIHQPWSRPGSASKALPFDWTYKIQRIKRTKTHKNILPANQTELHNLTNSGYPTCMLGRWSEVVRQNIGDNSALSRGYENRRVSTLFSELPPQDSWIEQGIVERRTVHANVVWRERKMILTKGNIFFARIDSNLIVDKILVRDISYIGKVEPVTSATGDEKNGQSSKPGRKKSILKIFCRPDEFESFNAALRETFAFEIKTVCGGFQQSYFVRAQSQQECDAWIASVSLCVKSALREYNANNGWLEKWQRYLRKMQTNHIFRCTVACAILLDFLSCVLKSELLPHHHSPLEHFFDTFDVVFFVFFAIELTLNIVGNWRSILGRPFISSSSNWFQLATVAIQIAAFFDAEIRSLKVVRIMRIFDIGETFKCLASFKIVLKAIRRGAPTPSVVTPPPTLAHPSPQLPG
jgi:hypothetical protein